MGEAGLDEEVASTSLVLASAAHVRSLASKDRPADKWVCVGRKFAWSRLRIQSQFFVCFFSFLSAVIATTCRIKAAAVVVYSVVSPILNRRHCESLCELSGSVRDKTQFAGTVNNLRP